VLEVVELTQTAATVDVAIREANTVVWRLFFAGNVGSTLQLVEAEHDGGEGGKPEPEYRQFNVMAFALSEIEKRARKPE
jgi:hypothetical protein